MHSRSRRWWLTVFAGLAVITVVFIVIAISAHTTPCKGLSCPSGGGTAQAGSGTSAWTVVGGIGGGLSGLGTMLSGVAAFRRNKPVAAASQKASGAA